MSSRPQKARSTRSHWVCTVSKASAFEEVSRGSRSRGWRKVGASFRLLVDQRDLKSRVAFVLSTTCTFERELGLRFAGVDESQELNTRHRGKAQPTDVLSFPAFEDNLRMTALGLPSHETLRLGDICLCVPVCRVQAREHRVSVAVEMERMIVHGICHLRGFDHERSAGAHAIMTSLEGAVRRELVRELGPARWAKVQEISS